MIPQGTLLKHYKRQEIQEAILQAAESREIAVSFGGKGYGRRPEVLLYPNDVLQFVKEGATSFHVSEEIWHNPMQIRTGLPRQELNILRKGWDLIIDIDCDELEYSKIAAYWILRFFKSVGISSASVKFSGNHGFHIGVPSEAFPLIFPTAEGQQYIKNLFPDAPRKIAEYLVHMIREPLGKDLLETFTLEAIKERMQKSFTELTEKIDGKTHFNPFAVLDIDTVLIASRHLYRMPYSFNEKSGLVSIPISETQVRTFDKEWAKAENIKTIRTFMENKPKQPEAAKLLTQAYDFAVRIEREREARKPKIIAKIPEDAFPEKTFPPCMDHIQKNLVDGKKRAVFILINFLGSVGWSPEQIDQFVNEWNKKHDEPLSGTYVQGQLRYAKERSEPAMPPNCDSQGYYKDLGICHPNNLCKKIKNPVQYAKRRMFFVKEEEELAKKEAEKEEKKRKREEEKRAKAERKKKKQEKKEQEKQAESQAQGQTNTEQESKEPESKEQQKEVKTKTKQKENLS